MRARALVFDFNGTLSHDEPLLAEIYGELFAARGKPMSAQEYFDAYAGLSDEEIVRRWLGADYPDADATIRERIDRYCELAADGSTVPSAVREAVRYAAARVPVVLCSAAFRREIDPVLAGAGLGDVFRAVVSADDVAAPKPDPECYRRALEALGAGFAPGDVVAVEDTEAGVAAAKGAGVRCVAVLGTLAPERLAAADELIAVLDVAAVGRLLS